MSEEDYHAAGFRGSLPILTAKPPYRLWFLHHPLLAMFAFNLLFLLLGLIKAILGMLGFKKISNYGMDKVLYQPKKIKKYRQPELKNINVVYDKEGYPIHPDTRERVPVVSEELAFAFNLLFFFFWPCLKCRECVSKMAKQQKKRPNKVYAEDSSPDSKSHSKADKKEKDSKKSPKSKLTGDISTKEKESHPPAELKSAAEGKAKKGRPTEPKSDADEYKPKGFQAHRKSISDSDLENQLLYGPIADPLNKEKERWKKGNVKIQAVRK